MTSLAVPYELTLSGSLVGPPMTPQTYPIRTEAHRRRVWPTFAGRRWARESVTTYVIREDGLTVRLRVR